MNETTHNGENSPQTETKTGTTPVNTTSGSVNNTPVEKTTSESAKPLLFVTSHPVIHPLKSLSARGISGATKQHFGIEDLMNRGLCYKTQSQVSQAGPLRFKGMVPGVARYRWLAEKKLDQWPRLYNAMVMRDTERLKQGIFIVQGEADVWPMHQSGLAAIALFGVDNEHPQNEQNEHEHLQAELLPDEPWGISPLALEELAELLKKHK